MLTEGCWSCWCTGQVCWCYYAASWPPSMSQVGWIQSPNTQSCDHQVAMSQTQQCLGVRCIIGHPSSGQMWSATMDTNLCVCSNALWTLLLHLSFIWGECLSQDQVFFHSSLRLHSVLNNFMLVELCKQTFRKTKTLEDIGQHWVLWNCGSSVGQETHAEVQTKCIHIKHTKHQPLNKSCR